MLSFRNPHRSRIFGQSVIFDKPGIPRCFSFLFFPVVFLHYPLCPHQDYNLEFTSPLHHILRGLPSISSCEPPFLKEHLFPRTVLVSTCRCFMESVGIYRMAKRLKSVIIKNKTFKKVRKLRLNKDNTICPLFYLYLLHN